jgi:hypothetical protein
MQKSGVFFFFFLIEGASGRKALVELRISVAGGFEFSMPGTAIFEFIYSRTHSIVTFIKGALKN